MDTITIISVILGLLSGVSGFLANQLGKIIDKKLSQDTLQKRIEKLVTSLQESTELISHIELEIKTRTALAEKLEKDLETYNQLAELKKSEVEAVAQLLRGELAKEGKKSLVASFIMNFSFFCLGLAVPGIIKFIFNLAN